MKTLFAFGTAAARSPTAHEFVMPSGGIANGSTLSAGKEKRPKARIRIGLQAENAREYAPDG